MAPASFGIFTRRPDRKSSSTIVRREIKATSKPDVKLNYDRTTPDKGHLGAFIGRAEKYSVWSDAGSAHARLAVTAELSGGVSAL
jgi:hypothetical protein